MHDFEASKCVLKVSCLALYQHRWISESEPGKNRGQVSNLLFCWIWSPFFVVVASHLIWKKHTSIPYLSNISHCLRRPCCLTTCHRDCSHQWLHHHLGWIKVKHLRNLQNLLYSPATLLNFSGLAYLNPSASRSSFVVPSCITKELGPKSFVKIMSHLSKISMCHSLTKESSHFQVTILIQPQHGIGFSFIFTSQQISLVFRHVERSSQKEKHGKFWVIQWYIVTTAWKQLFFCVLPWVKSSEDTYKRRSIGGLKVLVFRLIFVRFRLHQIP